VYKKSVLEEREEIPGQLSFPAPQITLAIFDHGNDYLKTSESSSVWFHVCQIYHCACIEETPKLAEVLLNVYVSEHFL
jgi:hypothetical protein